VVRELMRLFKHHFILEHSTEKGHADEPS